MKQKLKEKFNVGDKVKKTTFTKCVKMSKEVENLKNGVLNGDSVISNNHIQQQQQHIKLNNVDTTTKAIVGGRLQFYKDGKFILELARAREGEKTGWISVPRKTFWPPTISTNSSTTFSKHESSTSLSYSDDNSSIQSSPWQRDQRDHCWKQSRPRCNISKEMSFFFNRPDRLCLTDECQNLAKLMRRRPLYKCHENVMKFSVKKKVQSNEEDKKNNNETDEDDSEVTSSSDSKKIKEENDGQASSSSPNDSKQSVDSLDSEKSETKKKINPEKLDRILKKLAERISSKLALNGTNGHQPNSNTTTNSGTNYSLASHIASTINSTQPHQHVSPRKRILRELEKVSLEDTKRSRPKSIINSTTNGTNTFANGSLKATTTPVVSRPISSYSITSLLAHNTSSGSTGCNNNNNINSNNNNNSINSNNDSTSQSVYQQQQQNLNSQNSSSPPPQAKSPMHSNNNNNNNNNISSSNSKRKSPNQSPSQSPSPEHHAFHKYRPIATTPTSSSPFHNSYHSPNYLRGSPSPHDRLRTTGTTFQHSPSSHHYGTSSPQQQQSNYNALGQHRDSSLSPNVDRTSNSRSTPTNMSSGSGIRTVPKKTAALRQQFSSPTMESGNKIPTSKPTTPTQNAKAEKPMDVDALLRPSALIPPPIPTLGHHPATQLGHYPYMYPPMNYLPPAVPPYYPSFYNPAMMAVAAAAYRFPMPGYPPAAASLSPVSNTPPPTASLSYDNNKNSNGHPRNSSSSSSPLAATTTPDATHHLHHPYVPTSPWNPISLTNHHHPHHHTVISDGNSMVSKAKDEQSSDVPLNLSKH